MTDNSPEFENPLQPTRPLVTKEIVDSIGGELGENPDKITEDFWRLATEQTVMSEQMSNYVASAARDSVEAQRMKEAYVLTYRMLESQAQADSMADEFTSGE